MTTKVAVIQTPPVLLNRTGTIDAVLTSMHEAVGEGASLLVFPEAYIPGYPTWIWRLRPETAFFLCRSGTLEDVAAKAREIGATFE